MAQSSALGVGWDGVLGQKRLQRIVDGLIAKRTLQNERKLVFLARTPVTPVDNDDELTATFEGDLFAADIITDDQEAVVNDVGKFTSRETSIANIKHGLLYGQKQLNELRSYKNRGDAGAQFVATWLTRRQADLLLGIRLRQEALIVSCYRDDNIYDRYGIKVAGSWGTPPELKYVPPAPWNDPDESTPISDLEYLIHEVGPDMDALFVDDTVVTLSRKLFGHMIRSKEFQTRAKVIPSADFVFNFNLDGALPNPNDGRIIKLAEAVTGMKFEFYETKITEKRDDGGKTKKRILPHDEVLLSGPAVWNNREVLDLGNGVLTESLVAELVGNSVVGGLPNEARGPLVYAAPTTIDLNPPGITNWGASRSFPRKFDVNATGLLKTGVDPETGQ
jgi:hypothetical protein